MKANITLALSMLSLVLLIFVHEATPVSNGAFNENTQTALLNTGFIVVLVIILLLAITVLCFYKWNSRHSGQDGSAPRLLLGVRERMRGRVRSLEDWLGLSLWPGKRVVEGDEEEGEGGKSGDGEAAAGVRGGQDEGDSSDDYSSLDGIDLSERAKNLEDDEKKEALKRKSGSEGGQYNMKGERTDGRKEGGEEERTGKNSSEGDTCDLTAL